jgi:hypothetical protein
VKKSLVGFITIFIKISVFFRFKFAFKLDVCSHFVLRVNKIETKMSSENSNQIKPDKDANKADSSKKDAEMSSKGAHSCSKIFE